MTHGLTAERKDPRDPADEASDEDTASSTSNRFRIQIDAFGRLVPQVIPVDDGKTSSR